MPFLASAAESTARKQVELRLRTFQFSQSHTLPALRVRILTSILVYLLLAAVALTISWRDGAFHGEFGDYPDEAAHYVTGLMFHDYIVSGHNLSPIEFAENYYMHYPKVAIGHWPPVFYLIQATWEVIFPTSHSSLMILMAVLTGCLGFLVYRIMASQFPRTLAFSASIAMIALPLIQEHTTQVMADIPLAIFSLLAAIFFAKYLGTEKLTDALLFGAFSSLAILTKGSAIALAVLPPIAILLTRKWNVFCRTSLWASAGVVLLACGPWYWLTRHMQGSTWVQSSLTLSYTESATRYNFLHFFKILGWPIALLALFGIVANFIHLTYFAEQRVFWAVMTGLLIGFFIVPCIIPVGQEERYFLPAISAALAFAVASIHFVGSRLFRLHFNAGMLSPLFLLVFLVTPFHFERVNNYGFAPVAHQITSMPQFHNAVILIGSDADGEGMLISEIATDEKRPSHVVLRASKTIASGDWTGDHVRTLFQTPDQVQEYLDSIPVSVVIVDRSASPTDYRNYVSLLEKTMLSHPNSWRLLGSYSIWRKKQEHHGAALLYFRTGPVKNARGIVRIDMSSMLGKALTLELQSAPNGGTR